MNAAIIGENITDRQDPTSRRNFLLLWSALYEATDRTKLYTVDSPQRRGAAEPQPMDEEEYSPQRRRVEGKAFL